MRYYITHTVCLIRSRGVNYMRFKFIIILSLLTSLSYWYSAKAQENSDHKKIVTVDCSPYYSNIEIEELLSQTNCGTSDDTGLIRIHKKTIDLVGFDTNSDKPQCFTLELSNGERFRAYVNKHGLGRQSYANRIFTCDGINSNGLSRTFVNKKIAYFDLNMNIVHQTEYEFIDGSVICTEKPERYRPEGHLDYQWRGGICGYRAMDVTIDGNETTIVPIQYPLDAIPFPENANYLNFSFRVIKKHLAEFVLSNLNTNSELIKTEMTTMCDLPCDKYADFPALYNGTHKATQLYLRLQNGEDWDAEIIFDRGGHPEILSLEPYAH